MYEMPVLNIKLEKNVVYEMPALKKINLGKNKDVLFTSGDCNAQFSGSI